MTEYRQLEYFNVMEAVSRETIELSHMPGMVEAQVLDQAWNQTLYEARQTYGERLVSIKLISHLKIPFDIRSRELPENFDIRHKDAYGLPIVYGYNFKSVFSITTSTPPIPKPYIPIAQFIGD